MTTTIDPEALAYYVEVEAEARREVAGSDPFEQNYLVVSFVSTSAGRGRKRRPREIELVGILRSGRFYEAGRFPYDVEAQSRSMSDADFRSKVDKKRRGR